MVIARPFAAGNHHDPEWGPGKSMTAAFAAWDGGAGEIGARKSFSDWISVKFNPVRR